MGSPYCRDKRITATVRTLLREGWTHEQRTRHPRVTAPDGRFVSYALTPSDGNAYRAFERDVQRIKSTTTTTEQRKC